jgi:hypothetical protein
MLARGSADNVEARPSARERNLERLVDHGSIRRMCRLQLMVSLSLGALTGCSPEPVTVDLQFQGLNYFRIASSAEIRAYRQKGTTRCASLTTLARDSALSEESQAETGVMPLCDMRSGGAHLSLDEGEYDLLGIAYDEHDFVVVVGCQPAHVQDGGRVEILMATLSDEGGDALPMPKKPCASIDAACGGRCQ